MIVASILAVLAHPDDETFICGGTLAKYAQEGHKVILVCATKGEMGRRMGVPPTATRENISVIREQELKNACNALGVSELRFLGLRDKLLEIQPFEMLVETVLVHINEIKPDVIITFHETLGGHPDHCTIGLATNKAFQLFTKDDKYNSTQLYYLCWSNVAENALEYGFDPGQISKINTRPYLQYKLQAFRAHRTQTEMDPWVWKKNEIALLKFNEYEYFIQAYGPYIGKIDSLI